MAASSYSVATKVPLKLVGPMENTVICLDNSEFMRNSDYTPSRFFAQNFATRSIIDATLGKNPENNCAIVKISGGAEAVVSLTHDAAYLMRTVEEFNIEDGPDFLRALEISLLVMKRRHSEKTPTNKIIAVVGHPLPETLNACERMGKKLKKNNVGIFVVSIGEIAANAEKLNALVNATNKEGNSALMEFKPGRGDLDTMILTSPIFGLGGAGAGGMDVEGGDMEMDPEMAWALRESSMEAAQKRGAEQPGRDADNEMDDMNLTEDEIMARVLEMSMQEHMQQEASGSNAPSSASAQSSSTASANASSQSSGESSAHSAEDLMQDEELRRVLLESGIEPTEDAIRQLATEMQAIDEMNAQNAAQHGKDSGDGGDKEKK
eukprot:MONOS_1017.1-p1 / transcript=MONOS_1017.1 / gene=MONOS_1017 / organism=Monocercomonoides_exilis_PA203 / gene_product=26S proteasome nonATPase regulatory subunit putative / transcript_product=26S proteasome nonATPase regulatory subunit putative / location=Mono_scaffold00017:59135-61270(-) / protein_length=377 / sequence_SO=supercontig / SO=protein_coding / is_pseudo=false